MKTQLTGELRALQDMLGAAYSRIYSALLDSEHISLSKLDGALELLEKAVISLRNAAESIRPPLEPTLPEAGRPLTDWAGRMEITPQGWLHMELFSLLPTCRYKTPKLLADTLSRMLREYGTALPFFSRAALVIDEHCNLESRQVYDQDNKGWKAIPNALKGVVIADDDQFSLEVCLLSTMDASPGCHIYVLDQAELSAFFTLREGGMI